MPGLLDRLFSSDGFMPHGHCYLWDPGLVWLHVVSDSVIALSYTSIPFTLAYLARKRRDIPFNWMFLCFGVFIIACGTTHAMEVWTLWTPTYWLSGVFKAVTALFSLVTAALLVALVPKILVIPTPQQLAKAHDDLRKANEELESRVRQRTAALTKKNEELESEIAERKRTESALGSSEAVVEELRQARAADAHYRGLLDSAPDAMVAVDESGRVVFANLQTEALFGYARAELMGKPIDLLIPERFRGGHKAHVEGFFAKPGARAMGSGLQLFGRRKDGSELPIEVSLSPLRSAGGVTVSAAIRDVSERKRMEADARLLAQRLTSAVESIQDAFALFGEDDRLVLCNSVYRRLIRASLPGPIVGQTYETLLDAWIDDIDFPDSGARTRFREERLSRRTHDQTRSFDLRMRDGRSLRIADRRTAEGGIVKTIWDITDDVRHAEELREARAAAEAGSAAKSDFLSSMSHELRTPLNAILGFAQLLKRDKKEPPSDRHKERLDQILRGGEHLLRLIDDILDLARIEAGGVSISPEPVDVAEVISEVGQTLGPIASRRDVRIELEISSDLPLVAADRVRFTQILMNLGSNGIKYNRPGGKVTFRTLTPELGRVRIAVLDTGIGVPADKQDKLFQPFQRAGQETGPIEGTGIGLVITKRLARLMGGDVGFQSARGEGSEFWIDLPVHGSGTHSSAPPPVREASSAKVLSGGRRLVLYVEDNPANVTFMQDLVGTLDTVDLITAPTAEMGIELARARRPDAIVMDINLPGISGVDALRALLGQSETKDTPVIALTAAASERDRRRGLEAGFFQYLTKPLSVDAFTSALMTALER
jgi:PAS domain S-box-containing protein